MRKGWTYSAEESYETILNPDIELKGEWDDPWLGEGGRLFSITTEWERHYLVDSDINFSWNVSPGGEEMVDPRVNNLQQEKNLNRSRLSRIWSDFAK